MERKTTFSEHLPKRSFENQGGALVSVRTICVGEIITTEKPVLLITSEQLGERLVVAASKLSRMEPVLWAAFFSYVKGTDSCKEQFLSFPDFTKGHFGQQILEMLTNFLILLEKATQLSVKEDFMKEILSFFTGHVQEQSEKFVMVACVTHYCSIKITTVKNDGRKDELGTGLFNSGLMTHSCAPNCLYTFDQCGSRIVRAIKFIDVGERLTVDFADEQAIFKPTNQRREFLRQAKEYICHCTRCESQFDDVRPFLCSEENCNGICYASVEGDVLLPCTLCGKTPEVQSQKLLLDREKALQEQVNSLSEYDQHNLVKLDSLVSILDKKHFLTHHINFLKFQILRDRSRWAEAGVVMKSCIDFVQFITGPDGLNLVTKIECEHWVLYGEMYTREKGTSDESFTNALSLCKILYGTDSSYSQFVSNKITTLSGAGSRNCSFCGKKAMSLLKCSRCLSVSYCDRTCQVGHWKVHKGECTRVQK
eukprot:TRINITY_DN1989_c0_g1_i2.p1 TRINITY_DN1989_c0_g1~~TRINITY_DN1989_c0_g1_i2.p1  ORF type:complete len:480 (-),score=71.76 TRINITY_DN1989_c0_g1_i2:91-1530(-)